MIGLFSMNLGYEAIDSWLNKYLSPSLPTVLGLIVLYQLLEEAVECIAVNFINHSTNLGEVTEMDYSTSICLSIQSNLI